MQPLFLPAFYRTACQAPYKHILLFHKIHMPTFWNMKWQVLSGISAELQGSYCPQPPEIVNYLHEARSQNVSFISECFANWKYWNSFCNQLKKNSFTRVSKAHNVISTQWICTTARFLLLISFIRDPLKFISNAKYPPTWIYTLARSLLKEIISY